MSSRPRWKRYATVGFVVVSVTVVAGVSLLRSLDCVPTFYRSVDSLTVEQRTSESRQFLRQSTSIFNQIENDSVWSGVFRERQVNAWLAGDFARKHSEILPTGVIEPRVSFSDGLISLGFQMQSGPMTTVVSACGRVWLPEPNFVAVELQTARAGALPIPIRVVVDTVSAVAESAGLHVDWREHEGHPVALLRLGHSEEKAAIQIDRVELREGLLYLAGRSSIREVDQDTDSPDEVRSGVTLNRKSPDASLRR
jgi:hypothetical protein